MIVVILNENRSKLRNKTSICTVVLSSDALKPEKFQHHLYNAHIIVFDWPSEFFERKCQNLKKLKLRPSGKSHQMHHLKFHN